MGLTQVEAEMKPGFVPEIQRWQIVPSIDWSVKDRRQDVRREGRRTGAYWNLPSVPDLYRVITRTFSLEMH